MVRARCQRGSALGFYALKVLSRANKTRRVYFSFFKNNNNNWEKKKNNNKNPLTGRAVAPYSSGQRRGGSPLASFVLLWCGRAAERSIATSCELLMKAVCFVFPLLENTHGPKLPGFVHLTAAGAGRGAGGGLVLAGDVVAPGSGGPRLGVRGGSAGLSRALLVYFSPALEVWVSLCCREEDLGCLKSFT